MRPHVSPHKSPGMSPHMSPREGSNTDSFSALLDIPSKIFPTIEVTITEKKTNDIHHLFKTFDEIGIIAGM
jgi:hypothetical protein